MATGMSLRQGVSRGHSYRPEECLKRLFSIPSIPKAILALRDKPDVHESYEMQLYKAHEGHERRYLYRGRILQSYVLFLGDHVYFEIPV
jgi:hypothetical protein